MYVSLSEAHRIISSLLEISEPEDIRLEIADGIWSYGLGGSPFHQDPLGTREHEEFVFKMYGVEHVEDLEELPDAKVKELWKALLSERVQHG